MYRTIIYRLPMFMTAFSIAASTLAKADEAAVREMVSNYVQAFNQQDIVAITAMWAENGTSTDRETGELTVGREAIVKDIQGVFQDRPTTRLAGRVDRVRFIKPDVAQIEGETTLAVPDEEPSLSVFSAIVVNVAGKWQLDSIEESAVPAPGSPSDALRELEWLVGRWFDDSGETKVDTTIHWSSSNAFLLRSFISRPAEGDARQGTQVIGWDPRSRQIRSWTFNSDGSFGDATWSKNGSDWLIKSSQTLSDGRAASGTFVLTRVDDDTLTMQLIGHEIEGEPQPSGTVATVLRAPANDKSPAATQPK